MLSTLCKYLSAFLLFFGTMTGCGKTSMANRVKPNPSVLPNDEHSESTNDKSATQNQEKFAASNPTNVPENPTPIKQNVLQRCYFAVSGTYFGGGTWGDVFPDTKSGRPIGPGEKFDDVGGIYIQAKKQLYTIGDGSEADVALTGNSLDAVLAAPGTTVELLNAAGQSILKAEGPAIFFSSDDPYGIDYLTYDSAVAHFRDVQDKLPSWLADILRPLDFHPKKVLMHATTSIKVTKSSGGPCDY